MFYTELEAAKAYDKYIIENLPDSNRKLNFPNDINYNPTQLCLFSE